MPEIVSPTRKKSFSAFDFSTSFRATSFTSSIALPASTRFSPAKLRACAISALRAWISASLPGFTPAINSPSSAFSSSSAESSAASASERAATAPATGLSATGAPRFCHHSSGVELFNRVARTFASYRRRSISSRSALVASSSASALRAASLRASPSGKTSSSISRSLRSADGSSRALNAGSSSRNEYSSYSAPTRRFSRSQSDFRAYGPTTGSSTNCSGSCSSSRPPTLRINRPLSPPQTSR